MDTEVLSVAMGFASADEETRGRMIRAMRAAAAGLDSDSDDGLLRLGEVCRKLRRSQSWAFRLGIPEACGVRFGGGRPLYRMADVLSYLDGPECAARRAALKKTGWGRRANVRKRVGVRRGERCSV